jgi:hypothetical protein
VRESYLVVDRPATIGMVDIGERTCIVDATQCLVHSVLNSTLKQLAKAREAICENS